MMASRHRKANLLIILGNLTSYRTEKNEAEADGTVERKFLDGI